MGLYFNSLLANQTQLFNPQLDPQEINNLAGQPAQAKKVIEMTQLLKKQMKEFGDNSALVITNFSASIGSRLDN